MDVILSLEPEDLQLPEGVEDIVRHAAAKTGPLYGVENGEVSITLTNDEYIHELNKKYREIDRPTDVLSFAFADADEPEIIDEENDFEMLGDIIISVERAQQQAQEYGHSLRRELSFLTVHGMLHLMGYDHMDDEERKEMEQEQRFVMDYLGISREDGEAADSDSIPLGQASVKKAENRNIVLDNMAQEVKSEYVEPKNLGKMAGHKLSPEELARAEAEYIAQNGLDSTDVNDIGKDFKTQKQLPENHKSGFVAVIGRPNVGKSTMINSLIGQKIAIMSDKPQTTRNRIMCILTQSDAQMIFLDTPGIHKPIDKLGEYMVKAAEGTLQEVDAIIFVVDATEKFGPGERYILERLQSTKRPVILAINKVDLIENREEVLPIITSYSGRYNFAAIVPISAKDETNLNDVIDEVKKYLPKGPQYYPDDMVTDQPERLIIAELIREKVLHLTRDEVPHSIAVDVDEMKIRNNGDQYVRATIYVERDSQKGIIIGKKGSMLKDIGAQARQDIETLLGNKCFLDIWVKVLKDWRNRNNILKGFGFELK